MLFKRTLNIHPPFVVSVAVLIINIHRSRVVTLGTLSNLDDEPSGRRPEVFSRSRQLLRMSVMSSTRHSGRDICWFAVLRWTWAFKAIFDVSVPILLCLIPMFEKGNLFCTFCGKLGCWRKNFDRFSVNREPWFSMASAGKNSWVKVKRLCSP